MDDSVVVMVDAEGVIRFWSAGAQAAFGHAAGAALGQTLDLIVPPDYAEAHWRGFRRAMAAGEAAAEGQAGPFPARRADGEIEMRQGRLTLLRQPDGRPIGAMVVFS